jgi:glycosyltransferase involved in cell wall biosynthesis
MSDLLFSIITPVFRTPVPFLEECIKSVEHQEYQSWELLLIDDGNEPELVEWLTERSTHDKRIRLLKAGENVGIARASQLGVDAARGEFIALLDHDDTLSPRALTAMADWIRSDNAVDYLYSDEDKVDAAGGYFDPFFKPDWSPERFRHQMYTCHLSVIRTALVHDVGGFRSGFDGSQDYDLVLRVTERARKVAHIPEILYHWRAHAGSTASVTDQKPAAFAAAKKALTEHCHRLGIDATVDDGSVPGTYRINRRFAQEPLVSLIIPTNGSRGSVRGSEEVFILNFLKSVESVSTYGNLEIVVVHDSATDGELLAQIQQATTEPIYFAPYVYPETGFNFSFACNLGALRAHGHYLLFDIYFIVVICS